MNIRVLSSAIPTHSSIIPGQAGIQITKRVNAKVINAEEYRQSEYFVRNKEIWRYRFIENWSLKEISAFFDMSVQEVKEVIAEQKIYFQEEYE